MSFLSINVDTLVVSSELPVVASVFITVALLVSVESAFSVAASSTVAYILGIQVGKLVVYSEFPGALVNTPRADDKAYRDLSAYSSRT